MHYISTRGKAPKVGFSEALLAGLAPDGGLYVPEEWPFFTAADLRDFRKLSWQDLAFEIISPFVGDDIPEEDLRDLLKEALAPFAHRAITPLKQLDQNLWLMELFHGPTLAFKDIALQILAKLFDYVLEKEDKYLTIVGATSGDTGSAAIHACQASDHLDIFILHPQGRVSEIQRRQMTTVISENVFNIALDGTFDDCQAQVKSLFNDQEFRESMNLSAVNSINWARIMSQIVYYFWAALSVGAPERAVNFTVPTGNFGNIFAAYCADKMGLPIKKLKIATNENDILVRFLETKKMTRQDVVATISPSMDIQISSNFERLLFEMMDRDANALSALMDEFSETGSFEVSEELQEKITKKFIGHRVTESQIKSTISKVYAETGEVLDPHTAIGVHAATFGQIGTGPVISLACAHPAKFPDVIEEVCDIKPQLPDRIASIEDCPEQVAILSNDYEVVRSFILKQSRLSKADES